MVRTARKKQQFPFDPDYVTEPGKILQETLDRLGISQKEFAARTGYTTKHISQIITGKARITPESAVRLELVTRVPSRFWNNLETQFQDRKARVVAEKTAERDLEWLATIPTKELIKRGAIPPHAHSTEVLTATLSFFGVASVAAWKVGWSKQRIAFRRSAGPEKCTGGIAAWVRLAELEAAQIDCAAFDSRRFEESLRKIRELTISTPAQFVPRMHSLCAEAGVALALVPEIPGSRVSGAARWLTNSKAMIAVNLRGKRNDLFWFTFFHEAGHILNDGRDEVFVDVEYADDPREQAANSFAAETLIPAMYAEELRGLKSKSAVSAFAKRIQIHPGIVVGRLQHEKIIPYSHLRELLVPLAWIDA